jgi:hypothetical protein
MISCEFCCSYLLNKRQLKEHQSSKKCLKAQKELKEQKKDDEIMEYKNEVIRLKQEILNFSKLEEEKNKIINKLEEEKKYLLNKVEEQINKTNLLMEKCIDNKIINEPIKLEQKEKVKIKEKIEIKYGEPMRKEDLLKQLLDNKKQI